MTKKGVRLFVLGLLVVFLTFLTSSDLESLERAKFNISSVKLIVLDEGNELDQEYEPYFYDAAKKGYIVNCSVTTQIHRLIFFIPLF